MHAGHYVQLCHSDDIGKVTTAFEEAIALSFITNPMRGDVTHSEVKRRFNLCDKVFSILRADLNWSIPKIVDFLPTYLKCEIDGVPYSPESVTRGWGDRDTIDHAYDVPHLPKITFLQPSEP